MPAARSKELETIAHNLAPISQNTCHQKEKDAETPDKDSREDIR
jgi:hypothetical protein